MEKVVRYKKYQTMHQSSIENPKDFWKSQLDNLSWIRKPKVILDESKAPFYRWFPDGHINITYNCIDRHLPHSADKKAFIYEGNISKEIKSITYRELHQQVEILSGVIKSFGVNKGDRVIIYMPMILEAPIAMLATARIGAVHSVVFGGFSARELANRIQNSDAKLIISASCGLEPHKIVDYRAMISEARVLVQKEDLPAIFVDRTQKPLGKIESPDFCYQDLVMNFEEKYKNMFTSEENGEEKTGEAKETEPEGDSKKPEVAKKKRGGFRKAKEEVQSKFLEDCNSTDPFYILHTSGTTGTPSGVYRDIGGSAMGIYLSLSLGFGFGKDSVMFSTSDVGWVVGHSYIVYGPLLFGGTSILYEGKPIGTPDCTAYFKIVEKYKVDVLYSSPTAIRSIMKEDPQGEKIKACDLSSLRVMGVVGERTDTNTYQYLKMIIPENCLYNDTYWQTETGWLICANFVYPERLETKGGSCTKPYPGYNLFVFDDQHKELGPNTIGYIYVKLPMPPGFMTSLWNNDEYFKKKYLSQLEGYYCTGDTGYIDENGYVFVMSRSDDVFNVAGHRLSVYQMEEAVMKHPAVAEAVVVGIKEKIKGQVPYVLVVLKNGVEIHLEDLKKEVAGIIRSEIGPIATPYGLSVVPRIPKTRSGKVLRGTVQKILDNEEYKFPETIDDPSSLEFVKEVYETCLIKREKLDFTSETKLEKRVKDE